MALGVAADAHPLGGSLCHTRAWDSARAWTWSGWAMGNGAVATATPFLSEGGDLGTALLQHRNQDCIALSDGGDTAMRVLGQEALAFHGRGRVGRGLSQRAVAPHRARKRGRV